MLRQAHDGLEAALAALPQPRHLIFVPASADELERWARLSADALSDRHRDLDSLWWRTRSLPLLRLATEVGYEYGGEGRAFWGRFEERLGVPVSEAQRTSIADLFEAQGLSTAVHPGATRWERWFKRIAWPIAHALAPKEHHASLAWVLDEAASDPHLDLERVTPEALGRRLEEIGGGRFSHRFDGLLARHGLVGEVAKALLWEVAPPTDGIPGAFVTRLQEDLSEAARQALAQARGRLKVHAARRAVATPHARATRGRDEAEPAAFTPTARAELLYDWCRHELLVDLRPCLVDLHAEVQSNKLTYVEWAGGGAYLAELAGPPVSLGRGADLTDGEARLFTGGMDGLPGVLATRLSSIAVALGQSLTYSHEPEMDGPQRAAVGPVSGLARICALEAGSLPAGRPLNPLAGLSFVEVDGVPEGGSEPSNEGPITVRVVAPPTFGGHRCYEGGGLTAEDEVILSVQGAEVEVEVDDERATLTPGLWRAPRSLERLTVREPGAAGGREVRLPRVTRSSPSGLTCHLSGDDAGAAAIRRRRASLHVRGPDSVGRLRLLVSLRGGPEGDLLARHLLWIPGVPATLDDRHPLIDALAKAAHGADASQELELEVQLNSGAPTRFFLAGVPALAWRDGEGLTTDAGGELGMSLSAGRAPLEDLDAVEAGVVWLEQPLWSERALAGEPAPVLGGGLLHGPDRVVRGQHVSGLPQHLNRTLEAWGGGLGAARVVTRYLAWATATAHGERGFALAVAQREVVDTLDRLTCRQLCGDKWAALEEPAVERVRAAQRATLTEAVVFTLIDGPFRDEPWLEALQGSGLSDWGLVQALAPMLSSLEALLGRLAERAATQQDGEEAPSATADEADRLADVLNSAIEAQQSARGCLEDGVNDPDVGLVEAELPRLCADAHAACRAGASTTCAGLAELIRPPSLRARLVARRLWSAETLRGAARFAAEALPSWPKAHVRTVLALWAAPDALVLDDVEEIGAAIQRALADRHGARALRWIALQLRGDLDVHR